MDQIESNYEGDTRTPCWNRGLLIEFVGAAGVGKSTVLKELIRLLRARGLQIVDMDSERIKISRLTTVAHLTTAAYLAILFRPRTVQAYRRTVMQLFGYSRRRTAARQANCIHLCSEGIFQKIRAIYRTHADLSMSGVADRIFRFMAVPDFVIVIEASTEVIFERRSGRARPDDILIRDSVCGDVLLLQESVRTIEHVQDTIAPHLRMIRVNAEASSIATMAEEIAASIVCD